MIPLEKNRATESTTLNNGDVVVTYWGYSNVGNTNTNLNAQIVRADGTISEPIIIGTAGFTHLHQPFAIGDDSWGIAWDGNGIGAQRGTNVAIFNNDGEKIGSYFDVKDKLPDHKVVLTQMVIFSSLPLRAQEAVLHLILRF